MCGNDQAVVHCWLVLAGRPTSQTPHCVSRIASTLRQATGHPDTTHGPSMSVSLRPCFAACHACCRLRHAGPLCPRQGLGARQHRRLEVRRDWVDSVGQPGHHAGRQPDLFGSAAGPIGPAGAAQTQVGTTLGRCSLHLWVCAWADPHCRAEQMQVEGDVWQPAALHVCAICASVGGPAGAARSDGKPWHWVAAVLAETIPAVRLCGARWLPGLCPFRSLCGCPAVPAWVALQCPRYVS